MRYKGSLINALKDLFPEIGFVATKFDVMASASKFPYRLLFN
jgi:hypothetical protein